MVHMAQHLEEWPLAGKRIAKDAGIPPKYLSKILGDLVRAGVLDSSRGIGGGFRMVRSPQKITLLEILTPFEPFQLRRCPFGNKRCGDENPCLAHEQWKKVIETQQSFLRRTSVFDVAVPRSKRRKVTSKKRSRGGARGAR
jgi:Rrf2 family iron-sulfur cluster assembly transcriptional regulator